MPRIHEKHMTIASLIEALKHVKQDEDMYFDFCHQRALGLDSYRGYYEDVAIGWGDAHTRALTPGALREALQERIGTSQTGWKGGSFAVHGKTAVWVANAGETGDTAVVGIRDEGWAIIIETDYAG